MATHKLLLLPGDGIGPEVMAEVKRLIDWLNAKAIAAFERARDAYKKLHERNPDDIQSRVFSVVPLWQLGILKGRDGRRELEAALAILRPLATADRLDANRRGWIAQIEAQLAALEK